MTAKRVLLRGFIYIISVGFRRVSSHQLTDVQTVSRDISKKPTLPLSKCGRGQTSNSPLGNLGSEFVVHGEDGAAGTILFTSKDGRYNSGFFVGQNDNFMHQIDLVNYKPETRNVYVTYDVEYLDGHVGADASAGLLSVTGCQNMQGKSKEPRKTINLSKTGVAVTKSPEFTMLSDGQIIAGGKLVFPQGRERLEMRRS
jgi:hypothetical protein